MKQCLAHLVGHSYANWELPPVICYIVVFFLDLIGQQRLLSLELDLSCKGAVTLHDTMFGQDLQVGLEVRRDLEGDLKGSGYPVKQRDQWIVGSMAYPPDMHTYYRGQLSSGTSDPTSRCEDQSVPP